MTEEILKLRSQKLAMKTIAKQLNTTVYQVLKVVNNDQFRKSYGFKTGEKTPRLTDMQIKQNQLQNDMNLCKEWILKNYELSLCYESCILDIYKSYEYYILMIYNIKNETNLNPVSNGKMRKLLKECGFESVVKHYASGNNFYFKCERKAIL